MKIQFLKDFRGSETDGLCFYPAGAIVEMPDGKAQQLVSDGHCVKFGDNQPAISSPYPTKKVSRK